MTVQFTEKMITLLKTVEKTELIENEINRLEALINNINK